MIDAFFAACASGDIEALRDLIERDPSLVRASGPGSGYPGWTGLHAAARAGQDRVVQLLLERGADVHAREEGDNTAALHWAAAGGDVGTVRALLNAGADVHGPGDLHEMDVIGWAAFFGSAPNPVLPVLLKHGARHHIFSAIAAADLDAIRALIRDNPQALQRRMSRFEQGQSAVHFAVNRRRYDILDLLIEEGADLEAKDGSGQTALAAAMLRGDREAMTRLHAAGAELPDSGTVAAFREEMTRVGALVRRLVPTLRVPDIGRTLDWYTSIGFTELGRYGDNPVQWGSVSLGGVEIAFDSNGTAGPHDVSLWFQTGAIEQIYSVMKSRQMAAASAILAGATDAEEIRFEEDLYEPFYGGKQFSIRDLNNFVLVFLEPREHMES